MAPDETPWLADPSPEEARLQSLFIEAIEGDRGAALERAGSLRAPLAALLAAHDALPPAQEPAGAGPLDPLRWIGARFGDFTVERLVGSGSTADVYLARQRSPVREVVLKIRRARHGTAGQLQRFLAEAQNLARFSHPGVAHIYGSGVDEHGGEPVAWIAMERIDGTPLPEWRTRATPSVEARCTVVVEVARIVAAAHAQGIIHRDLAPRNITVEADGRPRVIDYGISRTLHALDDHPTIEGTPGFASPEQITGLPADPRDDVYALGMLLKWLVPDAPPSAAAAGEAAAAATRDARPSASRFAEELSEAIVPKRRAQWGALFVLLLATGAVGSWMASASKPSEGMSTQTVERLLAAVLEASSAERGGATRSKAIDQIARAEAAILAETSAPARVRWRALEKISTVWRDLGDATRAVAAAREAAQIAESDPDAPALIAARLRAWCAVRLAFAGEREQAIVAVRASLAELAASRVSAEDGSAVPAEEGARDAHQNYAQAHTYLALAAKLGGDLELAGQATVIAGPFHRSGVFAGTISQVTYLINAARLELSRGNLERALELGGEAVAASEIVEKDDPTGQLETLALHAGILERAGKLPEAAAIYRGAIDTWTRIAGPNDPKTITALNNLGLNTLKQGDASGAIVLLEDACARALRVHGESHQHTLDNHYNLVLALDAAGRASDAHALVRRFLPIVRTARGSPSLDELDWLVLDGRLAAKRGAVHDARTAFQQVIEQGATLDGGASAAREAAGELKKLDAPKPAG